MAGIAEGQEVQPQDLPRLRSAEGLVTLVGFGSLLSERSARTTFPDLSNLRLGRLVGWRRVFAHVAPIFFERGIANVETREMSSLSVEPCPGARCVVSLFEAPMSDEQLAAYVEREHEFRFVAVRPTGLDGSQGEGLAVVCARYSDEEYRAKRCPPEEFERRYGRFGIDRVWRDDVLPCQVYCRHCVLAAQRMGGEALESFLDDTYLADRKTTLREYLASHPHVMASEPPPSLAERYSG